MKNLLLNVKLIDMIFLTKFKPYKELSEERFEHLTFIFNRWIESREWQHYIKWCKQYDIERLECKQWMVEKMVEAFPDVQDMLLTITAYLGEFKGHGDKSVKNHFIKRIQESIDNGDSNVQVAFNMLTMIAVNQIERIGLDLDYFLDTDEPCKDEKLDY
jgi:hypothetical protein